MGGEAPRTVHFVGTYPALDATTAMKEMLQGVEGLPLIALPDGETQAREMWIARTAERQRHNPALEVVHHGTNTGYNDVWRFRVRLDMELTADSYGLDYANFVPDALDALREVRDHFPDRADLPLQVGIPNGLDHAVLLLEGVDGVRNIGVANEAVQQQIHEIHDIADLEGERVLFQLESPAALTLSLEEQDDLPPLLRRPSVAQRIAQLAMDAPEGAEFGVHLCLGDLNNEPLRGQPLTSSAAVVELARHIKVAWPSDRALRYLHIPIAGGDQPPSEDEALYRELGELGEIIPPDSEIIAGLAHEDQDLDTQRRLLGQLEENLDRRVGIAAACGLARRREDKVEKARTVVRRMRDLAMG